MTAGLEVMTSRMETVGETKVSRLRLLFREKWNLSLWRNFQVTVLNMPVTNDDLAVALAKAKTLNDTDDAFLIVNLDGIVERFRLWKELMPRIEVSETL